MLCHFVSEQVTWLFCRHHLGRWSTPAHASTRIPAHLILFCLFGVEGVKRTAKSSLPMVYHYRVFILYSWCTIKTTISLSSLFLSDVWSLLWFLQPLSPLVPRRPLHILYMFIATCHCTKCILGLGGKASKTNWTTPVSPFQWQTSQF